MQEAKGTLTGKRGLALRYFQWYPAGEPKAVTVLVHGYGEHMGRYRHVVEAMVKRGYAVWALDHRGHGESEGDRACVERFDYFVEDLQQVVREARGAHPTLPLVMVGHSMGGLIATRYTLRHPDEVDALVLSGPALRIADDVPAVVKQVGSLLASLLPSLPVGEIGENVLSRDPEVDRRIQADPLHYKGKMKARMGREMIQASEATLPRTHELAMPLLIMHGEKDQVTNPIGSRLAYELARSQDKTLKIWQDNLHEIFNELEKEVIIAYMLDWIDERVARLRTTQVTAKAS